MRSAPPLPGAVPERATLLLGAAHAAARLASSVFAAAGASARAAATRLRFGWLRLHAPQPLLARASPAVAPALDAAASQAAAPRRAQQGLWARDPKRLHELRLLEPVGGGARRRE